MVRSRLHMRLVEISIYVRRNTWVRHHVPAGRQIFACLATILTFQECCETNTWSKNSARILGYRILPAGMMIHHTRSRKPCRQLLLVQVRTGRLISQQSQDLKKATTPSISSLLSLVMRLLAPQDKRGVLCDHYKD